MTDNIYINWTVMIAGPLIKYWLGYYDKTSNFSYVNWFII